MKNINLTQIGVVVVIALIVLFIFQKCNNDRLQQEIGEGKILKEQLENKTKELALEKEKEKKKLILYNFKYHKEKRQTFY